MKTCDKYIGYGLYKKRSYIWIPAFAGMTSPGITLVNSLVLNLTYPTNCV